MQKLSRSQLRDLARARGLTLEALVKRSGIPMASLSAMLGETADDKAKDASLLVGQETYEKILSLIGINNEFTGLLPNAVREWAVPTKNLDRWKEAVSSLRKDLLSDALLLVELHTKGSLFQSSKRMVLIHDAASGVQLAVTRADKAAVRFLETVCGAKCARRIAITRENFDLYRSLIENSACRSSQFIAMLGGGKLKYSWSDVMAAAQQFDFQTDDLVAMIADARQRAVKTTALETLDVVTDDTMSTSIGPEPEGLRLALVG